MAISSLDQIQQAYIAYYGRPADPNGLTYWANQLDKAGGNLNVIINAFGNSAESTALYSASGSNLAAQVNKVYNTLFGRDADTAGLNFYVQGIQNGQFTLASVALNVFNGAQNADKTGLDSKLAYAKAFTAAIDTTQEIVGYSGDNAAIAARAALAPVKDAASLQTATANLDATVSGVTSQGNPGQTFSLTAGVDNLVGTAGNDTFNAGPSVGGNNNVVQTLTALDSIDGAGGTNNVLNVVDATAGLAIPANVTIKNIQTANIQAAGTLQANVSGWTGLTQVNASQAGGNAGGALTAAATTNVTLTDTAAAATTTSVQGGNNVTVTANGVTAAGTVNVGTTTAASGTVNVTTNMLASQTGTATADAINVKGGTTVTVTANLNEKAGSGNTVTGGAINVTGTAATTTVTVNQTADAAAADAVTATTGSAGATAVTAAPGVTGVAAAAASAAVTAKAAVAGVVDGAVTVQDANFGTTNANTITSVSLNNYGAGSAINDNALANLSLSGTAGTLAITNATVTAAGPTYTTPTANSSLNLTLNGLSAPTIVGGVVTSATGGDNTITDTNNEIKTLNVTTAGADSTLKAFADTSLTTLNVSGTNVLKLGAINGSLTTLNVSGAAGFNDGATAAGGGLAARGTALTITDTSSGKFTAVLDATTQSFVGSSGQDVITIDDRATASAFKGIAAGSATNNELILDGGAFGLTAAQAAKLTGFQTVGVTSTVTGTIDMSVLNPTASALDIIGVAVAGVTFNKVAQNASITLGSNYAAGTVAVNYADATGVSDAVTVTIGAATNKAAISANALTVADANGVGVGTLNLVSNDVAYDPASNTGNTIGTLTDNGLATLNVSGTGALTITSLTENTTQATSFTLNNTDTGVGGVKIGTFTDASLGNLSFTGTGNSSITTLVDSASVLNVSNTGTGKASIGTLTDALTTLTLNGNIALGQAATADFTKGLQDSFAQGVTISGATDNAHVTINLTAGANATYTDNVTLGNGNDYVLDASTAGKVNITVGTGSNLIDLSAGAKAATYAANVTLGAHTAATGVDSILVGGVAAGAVAPNTVITGAVAGDIITLKDAVTAISQATAAQQTTINAAATLAAAIATADTGLASHAALAFQYGGNTYVVENSTAGAGNGTLAAGDTLIQLVGAHTVGTTLTGQAFTLTA